jgi:hypothetical protein
MEARILGVGLPDLPWSAPYRELWDELALLTHGAQLPLLGALDRLAQRRRQGMTSLRFVEPSAARAADYERRIQERGEIETRPNSHDLFNALSWLSYPASKAAINRVHLRELAARDAQGGQGARGRARDAATLLDENGLIILTDSRELACALSEASWEDLFVTKRAAFCEHCECLTIGHGLAEKLWRPYKALTAHALLVRVSSADLAGSLPTRVRVSDALAARRITAGDFSPGELVPIPVLGLPGWWPANEHSGFYRDAAVFRPRAARRTRAGQLGHVTGWH